jgi:hypothetical protein
LTFFDILRDMKTWKILRDGRNGSPERKTFILSCPNCETDAAIVAHGNGPMVIAAIGLRLVFDNPQAKPPDGWLPSEIQCRKCRSIFSDRE